MKKRIFLFLIPFLIFFATPVMAQDDAARLKELNDKINEYSQQIKSLQSQANTLSNQIAQFNAQISLNEVKIRQTEEQIVLLGGRIDELSLSLGKLTTAFNERAVETYKMSRFESPVVSVLTSDDLAKAVSRYHYLRQIQESDRKLLDRLQGTQNTYKDQKGQQENLQEQLTAQKKQLNEQKQAKANLLAVTKNDEKKYQELLAATKSELEAIQAIIAGKGQETEAGTVSTGERIASVIQGASCNSGGTHLHFIVSENGITKNPFSYLKSVEHTNCSGSSCGSGDADPFNPSGNWEWPINPAIKFNQGYGSTWAVRNTWAGRIYNFHNGIDVNGTSPEVRAVRAGKLFRGSYTGSSGCRLRYVRVDHDENNLDTFYLHINY